MAGDRLTLNSLNGGEISPKVSYKEDLAKVQNGAELLENVFCMVYGGGENRAGLQFVTEVKDSTEKVRLQRFEVDGEDAMLIEAGELYFRYIYQGGLIDNGADPAVPIETVTEYTASDLPSLRIDQSNDVATVVDGTHVIKELARTGAITFTFDTVTFAPVAQPPAGAVTVVTTLIYNPNTDGNNAAASSIFDYAIATVAESGEESTLSAIGTSTANHLGYEANYNTISWAAVVGAEEYAIYKKDENSEYWGYIGRSTDTSFRDDGIAPSTADGPQAGENPFNATGLYPGIVTFVQQRRVFSKIADYKQTIRMSQTGSFPNFGVSIPTKDDDAVEFTLSARKKQDINHIVPLEKGMIVFTKAGEWRVIGRTDSVITPSSILPEPQSFWGSDPDVEPLIVGEQLLFLTRTARQLRDMEYSVSIDRYKSLDLTLMAEHLFRGTGRRVIAMDYAQEPSGWIFCVMEDGTASVLTYLKEHDVWGWSRMNTSGKILDVKVIAEGGRDVPYFLIERRIGGVTKKFIEFMKDRDFGDIRDGFFVDSGLTYDVPISVTALTATDPPTFTAAGHGLSVGDTVELDKIVLEGQDYLVKGLYDGRAKVSEVNGDIVTVTTEFDDPWYPYLRSEETGEREYLAVSAVAGAAYYGDGFIRKGVTTVSGYDHLEGRDVSALADGNVVQGLTVTGGDLVFDEPVFRVHAGLQYISRIKTRDCINPTVNDAGVLKGQSKIYAEVYETRGVEWGPNFEDLEPLEDRSYEAYDEPARTKTEELEITFLDNWERESKVCAQQKLPLPMTLQKITQEIEYGG
ncbi:hypothetical protein [uncultured Paraglaciecola sp.]|uniref:hypothetical protein n=1 Tax=uncultured Paraglaciecola sp. TaxID=1765024 RepID=UPI00261889CE|nr:hypothetical protein [uncultured Paraglaciecola sp.]